jgi:uncharacterized membrane protein
MSTSTTALFAGLLLAISITTGGFTGFLLAIVLGLLGYIAGAQIDGRIDITGLVRGRRG